MRCVPSRRSLENIRRAPFTFLAWLQLLPMDDLLALALALPSGLTEGGLLCSWSLAEAAERWLAERDVEPPRETASGARRADLILTGSAELEDVGRCCCMPGDAEASGARMRAAGASAGSAAPSSCQTRPVSEPP